MKKIFLLATFSLFFFGCNMNPNKEARIQKLESELQQAMDKINKLESSTQPLANNTSNQNNGLPKVDVAANLKALKITLPKLKKPLANYVHTVRTGNLVYTAGKGSAYADGKLYVGKLGGDLTIEQGQEAARLAGIRLLASLQAELGDLNKVKRIVKVLGMVNSTPNFTEHSQVINGFSDLMVAVFGERGKHARSAVGMNSLPKNLAVEIEMVVEVE